MLRDAGGEDTVVFSDVAPGSLLSLLSILMQVKSSHKPPAPPSTTTTKNVKRYENVLRS